MYSVNRLKKDGPHYEKEDVNISYLGRETRRLLGKLFKETPWLYRILKSDSDDFAKVKKEIRKVVMEYLNGRPRALDYYNNDTFEPGLYDTLSAKDIAAIRILDYLNHEGEEYKDLNLKGRYVVNRPFFQLWRAVHGGGGNATSGFYRDMLYLFRQYNGMLEIKKPGKEKLEQWMERYPSGLDPEIVAIRKKNKDRIIKALIRLIDSGDILRPDYRFEKGMSFKEKYDKVNEWWNTKKFHLQFAARSPERINKLLDRKVDSQTMRLLFKAQDSGIPFFVNPYYLSLLHVDVPEKLKNTDRAIYDYVFVSKELVEEFGDIVAWEKEDKVKPGKPNAAGWILPSYYNIHRRYPDVAILIPDTIGRACGGLCVSCQRMYDFQRGHLNFDLEDLRATGSWWERLPGLLSYFEKDAQLRDILITGGDALMSSDSSLKRILNEVYLMAERKKRANENKKEGEKYAEMVRVRLGTRLPVYLPQRITPALIRILTEFRRKAQKVGIKQFVIQTHFESPLEVTPEAARAVQMLISAGWLVTNQLVFTTAASRRGHTAKLRKVLNDIGVIPYYTFSVKGYMENKHNFTPNARTVQECVEEKFWGKTDHNIYTKLKARPERMVEVLKKIRAERELPFLSTDRSVMNLPAVGKSLSFRTIGLTPDGRRILQFEYDHSRPHSPITKKKNKVVIIESKSLSEYLEQLEEMGENISEYEALWAYSMGQTEPRFPLFEYPPYDFEITKEYTNLKV